MAEEIHAGEADSTKKVASVCGLWSAGVAALPFAYPLVFCFVRRFLFHCFEVLIQGSLLLHLVRSAARPSQDAASVSSTFMSLVQTSLYRSRGRPVVLFPDASTPYWMSFGMRPSFVR